MITYRQAQGLTLIELIFTIAIAAIIISLAAPDWGAFIERITAQQVRSRISDAFSEARISAVYQHTITTICPLDSTNRCSDDWSAKVTVFTDPNNKKRITSESSIEHVFTLAQSGTVRSSRVGRGRRSYFQYRPDGSSRGSIGHLLWCPESGKSRRAIQARVNFGGRIIWAQDTDGDGFVEDANGNPLNCALG